VSTLLCLPEYMGGKLNTNLLEAFYMYDLLLKGGTVLDPSQGRNEKMDVAITGTLISKVAASIPAEEASKVVDVAGKVVAPGLIAPLD